MHHYGAVNHEFLEKIKKIVGEEKVSNDVEQYSHDESPLLKPRSPDLIVKPETVNEISEILCLASKYRIPVTPRGSGTGLSGGAVPAFGGILLSLENLNKIIEVDENNFTATVESGVTLAELYKAVEERGLYYPLYPGEESATIGGNVATNAGGMRSVKYGVTRGRVLGLEAVLPTGEVIKAGGKYVKSSTGYDLRHLIIGSEGTLAVITKVVLKLETLPRQTEILLAPFATFQEAIKTVPGILRGKILPTSIEILEKAFLKLGERHAGITLNLPEAEAYLLLIVEAEETEEMEKIVDRTCDICLEKGAKDVYLPPTQRSKREVIHVRERLGYAVTEKFGNLIDYTDTVVPRSEIPRFMDEVKVISEENDMRILRMGHAGDGNIHLFVIGSDMGEAEFKRRRKRIFKDIFRVAVSLGGTISAEHGIGLEKKEYLPIAIGRKQIELMKQIKMVFDPSNILNPGKILPET